MDEGNVPSGEIVQFHRDLALVHRLMGNIRSIVLRLNGARSVIDIGCGDGAVLAEIRRCTDARVIGVDLRQPALSTGVPVVTADATRDPLPEAEAAISFLVAHHLTDQQVVDLIRNVGRYCDRFVIMDLVRHPLPLLLFTVFISPLLSRVAALDGKQSIRRAFTGRELRALIDRALANENIAGAQATVDHWVSPFYARQIATITYGRDVLPSETAGH